MFLSVNQQFVGREGKLYFNICSDSYIVAELLFQLSVFIHKGCRVPVRRQAALASRLGRQGQSIRTTGHPGRGSTVGSAGGRPGWELTPRLQNQPPRHYGITSAISLAPPKDIDSIHTQKLLEAMKACGVFEDEEELNHRYNKTVKLVNVLGVF
ncbi:uncharacterized protein ACIBXB_004738 [Morphnus guianensis]